MYQIDFSKQYKLHFIGIGGISMSGLAHILLQEGFVITGSDHQRSALTEELAAVGVQIFYRQCAENIPQDCDAVIYTAAVHSENPEYAEAVRRGIPMLSRAELLGQMMRNYRQAIGVAGTHGKTTTTSMLSQVLLQAGKDPTISVGGILPAIGGNIRVGGSEYFVTESCEYTNSFLSFFPTMEIVLNIEEDHLDFFKDLEDIRNSFRLFMEKLPEDGLLVVNGEIPAIEQLTANVKAKIIHTGRTANCRYQAGEISFDPYACASFTVYDQGTPVGRITLQVPGEHNIYNALTVIALCREIGIPMETIASGLHAYSGAKRRFEKKGVVSGVTVIDDYAHHPQEITAALKTALNYPHRKLWCVFQPHTYSRTKAFLQEFAEALGLADEVVLAPIYAARETDTLGVCSADIAERLQNMGTPAHALESFDEIVDFLLEHCVTGDLLITMGAGNIVTVGEMMLGE